MHKNVYVENVKYYPTVQKIIVYVLVRAQVHENSMLLM